MGQRDTPKEMKIFAFDLHSPNPHLLTGGWKHLRNRTPDHTKPQYWRDFAKTCERGKLDGIFLADHLAPLSYDDEYPGETELSGYEAVVTEGVQFPLHDPESLVPVITEATEHIGVGITLSTTYYPPYLLARKTATLDHLTEGRFAWNIVTSFHDNEAKNMGKGDVQMGHDKRYERGDEYMEVCHKLWDSWDDDAVVYDFEEEVYADPNKVQRINHQGDYFNVPGPLPVAPSPQGHPVTFQAGQSDRGREFAAKHAEAVFAILPTLDGFRQYVNDVKSRVKNHGRNPDEVLVFQGVTTIIGDTEDAAQKQLNDIKDTVNVEGGLALLSGHGGFDYSEFDPDTPIKEINLEKTEGLQGLMQALPQSEEDTLADVAQTLGTTYGGLVPKVVGTPVQVADELIRYVDEAGADGINLIHSFKPGTTVDFVEKVVPILQERGYFREEYKGDTLRENLRQ